MRSQNVVIEVEVAALVKDVLTDGLTKHLCGLYQHQYEHSGSAAILSSYFRLRVNIYNMLIAAVARTLIS